MLPSLPPTEPDAPISGIRFLTGELHSLLSAVVAWTGLRGPRSSPDWDRNRARSAVGEGLPFLLFRLPDGFSFSTMAHDSRSPPIIPDGQISRVRFETLAFLPKAFPSLERFKRCSVYTPAILVCLQPHLLTIVALRRFYQAGRHSAEEAAKCPEPLCPTSVLPPLGRCECHLLRGRYPSVIAPTGSCATPVGLSPASTFSLARRVLAGCTQSLLPPGASRRYL